MRVKCPGNLLSNLKAELFKCPKCFYDVELFSDEISGKCSNCGTKITREKMPSCIDWCPAAKECVGTLKWQEIKGSKCSPRFNSGGEPERIEGKKNESKKKNHPD